jgi:peptide/nickel transport system substrate-binding protein
MARQQNRQMLNLVEHFAAGELSRRDFVRRMGALGGGALFGGALGRAIAAREAMAAPAVQDPPPTQGGTVVAATIDKPVNMDPAFAELYSSLQVYQNVFNKLVYVDAAYNIIPGLATTWNQVDPTTWEFDLVQNAVFHNDEPFTSRDVAFTFERLFDPNLAAPNSVFFQSIDKVETDGDYKVRFRLKYPWGSFLFDLAALLEVVNEKAIAANDPRLGPVGTGPFKFVEWVQDDHITLQRWEKYHVEGRPYLDEVIFKAIADDTVRLTGLQTGELQWAMQVPLQRVDELKSESDIKSTLGKPYLPGVIWLNCTKPPFDNKLVRQAIAWAVNRNEIVDVAFFGQAAIAAEAINSEHPLYTGHDLWADGPDYDKAKALLTEAGVDGLQFSFDGQPQIPTSARAAQVLQQQLKNAGIEMEIQNYDSGEWITRLIGKEYSMAIGYWSASLDPAHLYYPVLHSGSGWNLVGYESPEMDQALEAFAKEPDPVKRKEAYTALIDLVQEEVPFIIPENQLQEYWVRANVYGMTPLPSMEIRMEPVYLG